jgi:putative serine protease PepD
VPIVTDGSGWRPGGADWRGTQNAWWSDALHDPWRDPAAPAAVVVRTPPTQAPPGEQVPGLEQPFGPVRRGLGPVFLVILVTALLSSGLGGTLGYVFAQRGGVHPALGGTSNPSTGTAAQRPPDSLAAAVIKVLPSVVTVKVGTSAGGSLGSGFVVSNDGYVVTNDHVVEGLKGNATVVFSDSTTATAKLVGTEPESDVAVLKVDRGGVTPIQFGDSDQLAVGDAVLAFGSPLALTNTVTSGIVSALDRPIEADEPNGPTRYYASIQTDAAVNHGNSGGPLVDSAGRVIGINSVIKSLGSDSDTAGNIGLAFAIPINQARRIALDIIQTGHARRTVIGAQFSNSYQNPNGGVEITSVAVGGPAGNSGLKNGDIVTRLQGVPLDQPGDLIALVRKYAPGASVKVDYQRDGTAHTAQVTLTADAK